MQKQMMWRSKNGENWNYSKADKKSISKVNHTVNDALKNENERIKAARHEEFLCLEDLMKHVKRLLKDNGRFDMVYRPDRMKDVIAIGMQYGLYPKRLKIAYASKNKQAKSILLEFVKNKNILLDIEAPAFLNDRDSFGWKGVQK